MEKDLKESFREYLNHAFDLALTKKHPSVFNSENMLFDTTEKHKKLLNIFNSEFDFNQFVKDYGKYFEKFKETYSIKSGNDLAFLYIQSNEIADSLIDVAMIKQGTIKESTSELFFSRIIEDLNDRLFNYEIDYKYFSSGLAKLLSTNDKVIDETTKIPEDSKIDNTIGEIIFHESEKDSIKFVYKFLDNVFQNYVLLYKHFAGIHISNEELVRNEKDKRLGIEYIMKQGRKEIENKNRIKELETKFKNKTISKGKAGKKGKFQTVEDLFSATKKIANYKNLSGNNIAKELGYSNKSSLNSTCDSFGIDRAYYKNL